MEGEPLETARARKRRPLRALAWTLGMIICVPLLATLGLLAVSALWWSDPAAHMPAGFEAYASLPSAGSFVREALDLKALDAILSTPNLGAARAAVRSLRVEPFLRTKTFKLLADVRVDAALYDGGAFVAAASLGYRAAALRLLPLALRVAPGLFSKAKGLSFAADAIPPRFELSSGGSTLYAIRYRDVLVVASSEALLLEAARPRLSGMNCLACYVHLKHKNPCNGCLGSDDAKPDRCKTCAIKLCARARGYGYCLECPEFPCKNIRNLERSYTKRYATSLIGNSLSVRDIGMAAFQGQERIRWSCKKCGGVVSLHDGVCSECGGKYPHGGLE
jgi:hypothetical protein